jgi:hypothetical protein
MAQPEIKFPLRRCNAFPCTCGACYNCMDDFLFWTVVKAHTERVEQVRAESAQRHQFNPDRYSDDPIPDCTCLFCVLSYRQKAPENLPSLPSPIIQTHVRRSGDCECLCGVCATCVPDNLFFNVVQSHQQHIKLTREVCEIEKETYSYVVIQDCKCIFCSKYRG